MPLEGRPGAPEGAPINPCSQLPFDKRWELAAALVLGVTTILRLCQLGSMPLVPDEAYYWDWSRRPSLGYYDQGPFIAYLIRATVAIFGQNEFGVRFGVLLSSFGALCLAYYLAKRCFSPLAGFLTVLLLALSPLMEVGSIISTYDPPLVFFWMLTVVCIERALFAQDFKAQKRAWILAGAAAGLGFLCKHTMLVVAPCLLLFLAFSPAQRFWLKRPQPYIAFGITLLMYSGVFWWNAHHHWWTFGHLLFLSHNNSARALPVRRMGDFILSQVVLVGPALFVGLVAGSLGVRYWAAALRQAGPGRHGDVPRLLQDSTADAALRLYLFCMGWPVFGLFLALALKAKVQGNWAAFAWITPAVLWSGRLSEMAAVSEAGMRRVVRTAGLASAVGLAVTLVMVFPQIAYRAGLKLKPDQDLTNQAVGWEETTDRVRQVRNEMSDGGKKPVFIVGSGYQYCSELAFYLPDHPETFDMFLHYRLDMYAAYVEDLRSRMGQDAIFINENTSEDADLRRVFTHVDWDPPMPVYRRPYYSEPIRTVYIARCRGYRLYTGTDWHVGG